MRKAAAIMLASILLGCETGAALPTAAPPAAPAAPAPLDPRDPPKAPHPYDLEAHAAASLEALRAALPGRWTVSEAGRTGAEPWPDVVFGLDGRLELDGGPPEQDPGLKRVGTYAIERAPGYVDGCEAFEFAVRVGIVGTRLEGQWDADHRAKDTVLLSRWTGKTRTVPDQDAAGNRRIGHATEQVRGETLILKRVGSR